MKQSTAFLGAGLGLILFSPVAAQTFTDLGALPGSTFSEAVAVNDNAQVVGYSLLPGGARAFLWQNGVMSDLGVLPGGTFSGATGINNRGQIVGLSDNAGGAIRAVLWQNGEITNLGTLSGGFFSVARAVNDRGQVVGHSATATSIHAFRSPYTERWSFGFQRQLPDNFLMDVSYIGSVSHKLATFADWNPRALDGKLLYPELGQRRVITSQGNSAYHALQAHLDRRFARGLQFAASYTWSRMLDSTSEGVGGVNTQSGARNMTSIPVSHGGLRLDRGVSDFDRPHRLTVSYLWHVPSPRTGLWRHVLGGWSIAGIITFQSGTPFTIANGFDRNNDGFAADRADIGKRSSEQPCGGGGNHRHVRMLHRLQESRHKSMRESRRCAVGPGKWTAHRGDSGTQYAADERYE